MSSNDDMELNVHVPNDLGWLELFLSSHVMGRLEEYIDYAKKNPVNINHELAGNITESISLEDRDDWFFKNVLIECLKKYEKHFPLYMEKVSNDVFNLFPRTKSGVQEKALPYCLDTFWVNFQRETDFNPMHNHSRVFSFVIWIKIPTDWREQHEIPISANSNAPRASDFEFVYSSMLGDVINHSYLLDKDSEGTMLFFPSKLQHLVHPFYNCDEERISISGNIKFGITEESFKEFHSATDEQGKKEYWKRGQIKVEDKPKPKWEYIK